MANHQSPVPHHNGDDEERFLEALASLTPKPRARRTDTLYSLVHRCFGELKGAKERGYSYEDLATLFQTRLGKTITPGTLRKYMNRAAKAPGAEVVVPDPAEVARDSTTSPVPIKHAPQCVLPPKRTEPKSVTPPRPTLYDREPGVQASEDEFENL